MARRPSEFWHIGRILTAEPGKMLPTDLHSCPICLATVLEPHRAQHLVWHEHLDKMIAGIE